MAKRTRLVDLVDAGTTIAMAPPAGDELAYLQTALCQVSLPRSRISGDEFHLRQGDAWIRVQAGSLDEGNGPVKQMVPYGPLPRLLLTMISTYVVRHKTREIPLGSSEAAFLGALGRSRSGGARGAYLPVRQQLYALGACHFQFGHSGKTVNTNPIEELDAWGMDSTRKWRGVIVVSKQFQDSISSAPVPLDLRAMQALRGSALALDIYAWMAQRLCRVPPGQLLRLRWSHLFNQFGHGFSGLRPENDFQKKFKPALFAVLTVYPRANVKIEEGGLVIRRSDPPVPRLVY